MPEWFGGSALNNTLVNSDKYWVFQWERLGRYKSRVEKIQEKSNSESLSDEDLDDVIAFFMNAFHLKDWLVSCNREIKSNLLEFFKSFEMGCCRDIANGFKHRKLNQPSVEDDFNFYRIYDYLEVEKQSGKNPEKWFLAFEDPESKEIRKWEVFDLVVRVYDL